MLSAVHELYERCVPATSQDHCEQSQTTSSKGNKIKMYHNLRVLQKRMHQYLLNITDRIEKYCLILNNRLMKDERQATHVFKIKFSSDFTGSILNAKNVCAPTLEVFGVVILVSS